MPSEDTRCGPCAAAPHRQVPPPDSMQSQGRLEMTTEQRCGLEGGVGLGCRAAGRAEAFARSLHHKLCSLGGPAAGQRPASPEDADDAEDTEEDPEDSWSSAPSAAHRTLSSSSVDSSSDMYYDLDFSPQSPQEEITSQELAGMMAGSSNRDGLNLAFGSFAPHNGPQSPQSDCSSDYFDTDAFEGDANRDRGPSTRTPTEVALPPGGDHGVNGPEPQTNGEATARLTNGTTAVNGHGSNREEAKAKRPWNRVPHKYKAGTPEAMSEVSQLELDDCDDDEEEDRPRIRRGTLAKLSFAKSSQTLMQEGLIAQLKQGLDIPPELKNGVCPGPECAGSAPANGGRGLAAMKEAARTLEALETPEESSAYASSSCDGRAGPELPEAVSGSSRPAGGEKPVPGEEVETERCEDDACDAEDDSGLNGHEQAEMDGDDDEGRRPRIRRCSSLKTGKTPPGTPGRKKIVRFADVLGLDLADVRTFLDEIPKVPTSAYSDLRDVDPQGDVSAACCDVLGSGLPQLALAFHAVAVADAPPPFGVRPHVTRVLVPLFQQPGGMVDFLERVRERQVCLENAVVADPALLSIAGQVRVRNLDFHKTVHLRYTTDGWRNFADLQATYVPNSCDGFSDKFTFTLFAGHTMTVGQRLEMAVRFQCKGQQYWDSNGGANYCFQCLPPSSVPPTALPVSSLHSPCGDDSWKYLF